MNPVTKKLLFLTIVLVIMTGCTKEKSADPVTAQPSPASETAKQTPARAPAVAAGDASGSFTAKGQTVQLKHAYATRAQRFSEESVVVLVTDQPIPAEALAQEFESQSLLLDEKIRGLEYVFMKDGYWVRYHPGQYQESKSGTVKLYTIDGDVVKGEDEDDGGLSDGKYARSVKFAAPIKKF